MELLSITNKIAEQITREIKIYLYVGKYAALCLALQTTHPRNDLLNRLSEIRKEIKSFTTPELYLEHNESFPNDHQFTGENHLSKSFLEEYDMN